MKKKIVTSVVITVLFALLIITSSFMALVSIQEIKNTKSILKNYNDIVIHSNNLTKDYLKTFKINNVEISFTLIDKSGKVLYGDKGDFSDNEINDARNKGLGYSERHNPEIKQDMIYCATSFDDGMVLRSGVPIKTMEFLVHEDMKYYLIVLGIVFLLSIALALKLVRLIVEPVKNLENVTFKIANGDLNTRVHINSNDELGSLGKTFNNMADQLQSKIREVLDKQNRLESILRSMQSGVIALDRKNNIITMNPYAKDIFGIKKNIVGENISNYIDDKNLNKIMLSDNNEEKEIKIKKPYKKVLKIKKDAMINGYERIGDVIAIQDITEMKRLENMRTQFVANVSHELKTPLTSIKGFSETLRFVEDKETRDKFLDIIDKESTRLTRLIDDILTLSNLENCEIEELEEFLPDKIIEDAVNILKDQSEKKNIKIHFDSRNRHSILGREDKFLQVAINLIENAIKYSDEDTNIYIKSYTDSNEYILKVKDEGMGIPKEDLPRIFERFYRVDKARKRGGTGLGLAITKHIIKSFGGTIEVDSDYGIGSTFTFKIKYI
ncbi:cell wall metabolism sensor histidine kinase WalK [Clostridium sp. LY3-2]|uniref:HAMP domain-containing sensor histidine kinase n=1 Tax=Clostridium sp. LY3-2 TaxID=2942482 RepID=UPI0021522693|nr:HAMP domain-containing sensor histidine kinase [Clostridium sp. LY3-2]MCR6515893.1 cell wall metabolism sensor histidine kinase WalK [Clostridium sp. LY3-2]